MNESGEELEDEPEDMDEDYFEGEKMLEQARVMSVAQGGERMSLELLRQYTEKYRETLPSLEKMILELYNQNEKEQEIDYAYNQLNL